MRKGKLKKISSLPMRDVGFRIPSLPSTTTLVNNYQRISCSTHKKLKISYFLDIVSKNFYLFKLCRPRFHDENDTQIAQSNSTIYCDNI